MTPPRIYIDTSVLGGCFEAGRDTHSLRLIERARNGEVILLISAAFVTELAKAPPQPRALLASLPSSCLERVPETLPAFLLHRAYLAAGIVTPKAATDALHVANATVAGADMIVSWNFTHIVHMTRIGQYNAVNAREGYGPLAIKSPRQV